MDNLTNNSQSGTFNAVQFSKTQLESIFDNLEPMCLVDNTLKIIRLNKPMAQNLQRDLKTCIGKPLETIFVEWDSDFLINNVELVFSSNRPIQVQNFSIVEKGKKGWFEIIFYPVANDGNQVKECVIYFKNVTELFLTKKILLEQYKKLEDQQRNLENKNALLIETRRSLDKAYQSIMDELSVAREVQQGILPATLPQFPGIDFYSSYEPISQVGGDVFDIMDLGDDKVGIFIGDVSGHGLPAAFVGAMVKMSLVDHASKNTSPVNLFNIMNASLIQNLKSGHYLTAFYGIFDLCTHNFCYSKASHPQPLLIRSATSEVIELETKGMFLGLMETPGYEEREIKLHKGDRIYFFTDGYFEVMGKERRRFTYQEFSEWIKSVNHFTKKEAHGALQKKIKEFTGDQEAEDDRTILILEVTDEAAGAGDTLAGHFADQPDAQFRSFKTEGEYELIFNELEERLESILNSETLKRNINLCAMELANNALEHGHKWDESKTVEMAFVINSDLIRLGFLDQGEGFNIKSIKDPRDNENRTLERGRGVFITRSYMDSVHYNSKGNMVVIEKLL